MGIKMSKVKHKGEELRINDYDKNKKYEQLKCFYCNANVSYVDTYKRNLGDKEVTVTRYFRLKSGTKHAENCKYEIDGAMLDIVARCADNALMTKQDNKFKVRLLLISEQSEKSENVPHDLDNENGYGKQRKNYIPKGKKNAYLSSMKKIMQLRSEVERNSDLGEKIDLQFTDKQGNIINIPWNRFYFEATKEADYEKMLKYLKNHKRYHPICVDGYIKSVKEIKSHFILNLEPIRITNNTSHSDERVSISYFLSNKQIFESFVGREGSRVIIYSLCNFKESRLWSSTRNQNENGHENKKIVYHQITGNVNDEKQVLILDTE